MMQGDGHLKRIERPCYHCHGTGIESDPKRFGVVLREDGAT
jgi:hypothetical protein